MTLLIADIVIPEWLASIVAGAGVTASMACTGWLVQRVSALREQVTASEKCALSYEHRVAALERTTVQLVTQDCPGLDRGIEGLQLRMQHLEDRLGTKPPFQP